MKVHLAIRGFLGRKVIFEERAELDARDWEKILPEMATKHAKAMASHQLHMIEIEFLDEPDVNQRFFRFGTDPAGMIAPILLQRFPEVN